jgi:hypothetical protein
MRVGPIVWINAAFVIPAAVSLYADIRNSLSRSQDFEPISRSSTLTLSTNFSATTLFKGPNALSDAVSR